MQEETPYNPLEGERPSLNVDLLNNSDEQISIVIVHHNRPEYLSLCLQSIAVASFNYNFEIIVVDNASTGTDVETLFEDIKDDVKLIRNEKNLYWSAACNKGADAARKDSKYIVFMHCDIVITEPTWLDLLISVAESHKAGLVGVEMQQYVIGGKKVDSIREWLLLLTRDCWEECGPFPEKIPMVGSSFILTMNASHKGYKPQVMKNPIAHHYKIFSMDVSTYEMLTEKAMIEIPRYLNALQSRAV